MNYNMNVLIHDPKSFSRKTLLARLKKYNFNNLARMELFLWDLEIFLQIQSLLKSKVVLKGGAAVQFYLPIEYQRSSIDIDLMCTINKNDIEKIIKIIEDKFENDSELFKFKAHSPQEPKTTLPLYTFHMTVPSICKDEELFRTEPNIQEVKIEFFTSNNNYKIKKIIDPSFFVLESNNKYNVLNINQLFADKLTTIGPKTIGIQKERYDELVKQLYDLDMLFKFNYSKFNFNEIRNYYISRAKLECKHRKVKYNLKNIKSDVLKLLHELSNIDFDNNTNFIKLINDFQSLYLRRSINRDIPNWAIAGCKLYLIMDSILNGKYNYLQLKLIFSIESYLTFNNLSGPQRGKYIKNMKTIYLDKFMQYYNKPRHFLQGKNLIRLVWMILSKDNLKDIYNWIRNYLKKNP